MVPNVSFWESWQLTGLIEREQSLLMKWLPITQELEKQDRHTVLGGFPQAIPARQMLLRDCCFPLKPPGS